MKDRQRTKDLLKKSIDRFSGSAALLSKNYHLEPVFAQVSHEDTFLSVKSVCQLVERDVVAVIGIDLENLDNQVASILNYFGIPFLQINPGFLWQNQRTKYNSSINMYPSRKVLAEVIRETPFILTKFFFSFEILYDQFCFDFRSFCLF